MRARRATKIGLEVLIVACAFLAATPARAALTPRCQWGVGALAPTVWPASNQVMMTPTVMDLGGPPLGVSKVAFVSFESYSDITSDKHGVLRIIDLNCNEIARFPGIGPPPPIPASCLPYYGNLNTAPHLAPMSGLALGNIDTNSQVEIIGVLDDHTTNHGGIIAFRLVAGALVPLWCSQALAPGDVIPRASAPAIAQLDGSTTTGASNSEIILDNKIFNANGSLRYSGFSVGGNNCATLGGAPCPRSQTAIVANLLGAGSLPQVITGRGTYKSIVSSLWTGTLGWVSPIVSNTNNPAIGGPLYPGVAELEPSSPGPEIVVVDSPANRLRVLTASGTQLASVALSSCGGGPPLIGDVDQIAGSEIGVSGCSSYTVFKYNPGLTPTLSTLWAKPTHDLSGSTTAALYNNATSARIYYADEQNLWVFNGANGAVLQSVPNSSATFIEGPVVTALGSPAAAIGTIIVSANDVACGILSSCIGGGQHGLRIFNDPAIGGNTRSYWNQHTYHVTNVTSSVGAIPVVELPSWLVPARNTYRGQQ